MRAHGGERRIGMLATGCALFVTLLVQPALATTTAAKPATRPAASSALAVKHDPQIRSSAVLIVDEADSSVLLSRNADVAVPIASITKLMTSLVVLEAGLPLDESLKMTREDTSIPSGGPSRLPPGAVLTRGELLHLALMSSENHAAHALGRTYPGGTKAILEAMNLKARELGMKRTHFTDTTGLSKGNIASPEDLARLVIVASKHPVIRKYSTDDSETVMVGRYPVEFRSTNNLTRKADWDIIVQKTGYTQAAGRCLVMKTLIENRPVVMVLLNSFGKYTRVADAARVRRWIEAGLPATALARSGK